jgi:hypothetical protein
MSGLLADTYIPLTSLFNVLTVILTSTDPNSVFDIGISIWICTAYNISRKKMDVTRKRPLATVATLTVIVITSDMVSQRLGNFHIFHSLRYLVW